MAFSATRIGPHFRPYVQTNPHDVYPPFPPLSGHARPTAPLAQTLKTNAIGYLHTFTRALAVLFFLSAKRPDSVPSTSPPHPLSCAPGCRFAQDKPHGVTIPFLRSSTDAAGADGVCAAPRRLWKGLSAPLHAAAQGSTSPLPSTDSSLILSFSQPRLSQRR